MKTVTSFFLIALVFSLPTFAQETKYTPASTETAINRPAIQPLQTTITFIRPLKQNPKGWHERGTVSSKSTTCDLYGTQHVQEINGRALNGRYKIDVHKGEMVVVPVEPGTYQLRTDRSPALVVKVDEGQNVYVWPRQHVCSYSDSIYKDDLSMVEPGEAQEMMQYITKRSGVK